MASVVLFKIQYMHSQEIENYKKGLQLTKRQRELVVGKLLGDAHLEAQKNGRTYRLVVEHSLKQKAYVDWLYNEFKEWVLTKPKIKIQTVGGKQYQKYYFRTVSSGAFRFYHHQFYPKGKKVVPPQLYKWLTPLGLAVWFMDDGSIKSNHHRARILNTQGFTKKEVTDLTKILQQTFQLKAQLRKQREGYQVYLLAETIDIFARIIRPHIISSMRYKLEGLD
jgi:DNA-binding transcriptional regulator WhiA